jgi:hypothetical protein
VSSIGYARLLRQNRDFRLLWGGQVVSQLGDWFNLITLQSLLLHLTGSASSVAGLMAAQMLPVVALGPVAGVVVDRLPRKTVMIGADLARAAIALGFLLVRDPGTAWLAYLFLALLSSLAVFFEPARLAVTPVVTRPEELVTANALGAVTWSVLLTTGGLVGGAVATYFGRETSFVLNSLSFVASALFLRGVRIPGDGRRPTAAGGFGDLVEGFRYVAARGDLAALLSAKAALGVTGGLQVLIALFGQQIFPPGPGKGALGISYLTAASGVGTALGPIIARAAAAGETRRLYWALPAGYLWGGVFLILLGRSGSLATAAAPLFLGRMGNSAVWVTSTILLQAASEDRFRGRVFAAEQSLATLTMALSGIAVGAAVDHGASAFTVATVMGLLVLAPAAAWGAGLRKGSR